jgi:hypothetical protein
LSAVEKKEVRARRVNSRKWINNVQGYLQAIAQKSIEEQTGNQKLERQIE